MLEFWYWLLGIGLDPKDLSTLQMGSRAILVFFAAVLMVRLGDRRFLSRKTAFDAVLGFILASTLARAVNGSAPLVPTLVAGIILVLLHRMLAKVAAAWHPVGVLVKGRPDIINQDGALLEDRARAANLSENDIVEDLRLNGGVSRIEDVAFGYMERNGSISVVPLKGSVLGHPAE